MYTSRLHKFSLKNTSLINIKYTCKIVSAETGKIDPGFFMITNHNGNISPGCD
jgi:hydrocephalus-inducing protein